MKHAEKTVWIYADWDCLSGEQLMGILSIQRVRGKEVFSFEYNESWMTTNHEVLFLDPNLGFYKGKQFLPEDKNNFGLFLDSAPDRWGRMLMRRKEALQAKLECRPEKLLFESDYLLGVFDGHRMGAIRFKLDPNGEFLDDQKGLATPPWTSLRELEHVSLLVEGEDAIHSPEYAKWLKILIDPGSSLGGARPKASVVDENSHLWIAKFPSLQDDKNMGAWEMVLHQLAKACSITVPEAKLQKFSSKHHTFLSKRFDRTDNERRIHFASAMTLLGHQDGTDHLDGVGYLDLAGFIIQNSPASRVDLEQLWRRMVFNILVSNTDDHLRNHGFTLTSQGWRLSPAYDMNPNEMGNGLTLNITESSNEQDLRLAMETAHLYQLKLDRAQHILKTMQQELANWFVLAKRFGILQSEIESMKRAFRLVSLVE